MSAEARLAPLFFAGTRPYESKLSTAAHQQKSPELLLGRFRDFCRALFVIPTRFERVTHSLEGCCSIQLSYGTKRDCKDNKKSGFPMTQCKSEVGNHSQHYNQHGVGLVAQGGIQNPGVPAGRVDALQRQSN